MTVGLPTLCTPWTASNSKNERFGITIILTLMVVSSPFLILSTAAYVMGNPDVIDTSGSHATLPRYDGHSPTTSSLGTTPTIQAPLQIPRTLQSNDLVNSLAFYEVTFITSTAGAIDRIRMDFPVGTNIAAAGVIERVGIGGGTLLKSGSSITYDVTSPVSIPAGTFIRLEMFGIKNPITPSTTFTAMITTRDSGGGLIDGPSVTNVYTIKKIVSSDIADGAITSTKPAESFMKRITLEDDAAGHAAGWNPNGGVDDFFISEPSMSSNQDEPFFIIEVTDPGFNKRCAFGDHDSATKTFLIECEFSPLEGAELHYVLGSLPAHVQ